MTTSPSNPGDITLPIAEIFTSVHGEGYWAGTPMTFIRLAGCTVGKARSAAHTVFPILPTGKEASMCTTFDGRNFPCDTDYSKTETLTLNEIYNRIPTAIEHVCITGGEPLMHGEKFVALIDYLSKFNRHVETSGSIKLYSNAEYVVCSPKVGYIPSFVLNADEVRIAVGQDLSASALDALMENINPKYQYIYFSPLCIGDTNTPDPSSLSRCIELVMKYPNTKISIQMHKILGVR